MPYEFVGVEVVVVALLGASMITVRVEVEVKPFWSVTT